jgi:broad specificity phosphatase PhoE
MPMKETRRCYSLLSNENPTIISSSHYDEASIRQRQAARSFFSFSFSNSSDDDDDGDDEKNGVPSRVTAKELIIVRHGETDLNKAKLIQGGQTDVELNSVGKDQAEKTGKAILEYLLLKGKEEEAEEERVQNQEREMKRNIKIYSSPLLRTVETAQIISEKLSSLPQPQKSKSKSIPIIKSNAIQEWDLDSLEGLNVEQATAQYPNSWNILKEWYNPYVNEELISIPIEDNGESMEDVRIRIESYLENIVYGEKDTDDAIIIVTHGAVLGQLLRHIVVSQHDDDSAAADISVDGGSENNDEQQQQQNQYHRPQNACITRITICPNTWKWTLIDWANADHLI